jgi:hypothetical protein
MRKELMNKSIKIPKTIWLCYENPFKRSWLVHDGNNNFSIMTQVEVEDNKDVCVFKKDKIINSHIRFLLSKGFDFRETIGFLPMMIELTKNLTDEEIITKKED